MSGELDIYRETKKKIDKVSPSFCLAKWQQVTLHLHNGHTHSCHHPQTHKIPLQELKDNPSALHNTNYKKQQRKKMLEGYRPSECQYCWNVEDLEGEHFSDRTIKSSNADWAAPYFDDVIDAGWEGNITPRAVEVSFGNACNFKCTYCSPIFSSKWQQEIQEKGPYPTSQKFNNLHWIEQTDRKPFLEREDNPYVDAFWRWWPELRTKLTTFRITGGEPLMNKNTFQVMDDLIENPNTEMALDFNTNLCVPDKLVKQFVEKAKVLTLENKVDSVKIHTSVDTHGAQAEWLRTGLNYQQWLDNMNYILTELPTVKTAIMCTTNALSLPKFKFMLRDLYNLKVDHYLDDRAPDAGGNGSQYDRRVSTAITMAILRHPHHLNAQILPKDPYYWNFLNDARNYMASKEEGKHGNKHYQGFFDWELDTMDRFIDYTKSTVQERDFNLETARRDFRIFVDESDKRNGTNFLKTFPEYADFYHSCGALL
tara:strand:- start:2458 stop:3903 length:1446 start_codon:yes stop_codon:yes gene_type:complete